MSDGLDPKIAALDPAGRTARQAFLSWQCRLRQISVRRAGGQPSAGMRPWVIAPPDGREAHRLVVLIRKRQSDAVTQRFRHMVRRTRDPAERRQSALEFLAAAYYQDPESFSDEMTALLGPRSALVGRLLEAGRCTLEFELPAQPYRLAARVTELEPMDEAFQFTFWHNSLFNPALPGDVRVLAFRPDWRRQETYQSRNVGPL